MTAIDYIVFALVVACTIGGSALAGFMVAHKYEIQQRENIASYEAACSKVERKVDELENLMASRIEKITVVREDGDRDMMTCR